MQCASSVCPMLYVRSFICKTLAAVLRAPLQLSRARKEAAASAERLEHKRAELAATREVSLLVEG